MSGLPLSSYSSGEHDPIIFAAPETVQHVFEVLNGLYVVGRSASHNLAGNPHNG